MYLSQGSEIEQDIDVEMDMYIVFFLEMRQAPIRCQWNLRVRKGRMDHVESVMSFAGTRVPRGYVHFRQELCKKGGVMAT